MNPYKNELKKALTVIFDISYNQLLKEYLEANILASEYDFIDYLIQNQKEILAKITPEIDFYHNDSINSIEEYENIKRRDQYWFFNEYTHYLKEKRQKLSQPISPFKKTGEKPLSMAQISLKYVYSGMQITRENGDEIAKSYGHTSGEKLFQKFSHYSSPQNRKGKPQPCTPRKLQNKISLLESVIELVPNQSVKRVEDEIKILKGIRDAEFT